MRVTVFSCLLAFSFWVQRYEKCNETPREFRCIVIEKRIKCDTSLSRFYYFITFSVRTVPSLISFFTTTMPRRALVMR